MVERVADQMYQWIAHQFDQGAVNFGFLATDDEVGFFPESLRQIAHEPGKPAENRIDRHHAGTQCRGLQLFGDEAEARRRMAEGRVNLADIRVEVLGELKQPIALNHQFPNQIMRSSILRTSTRIV